MKSFGEFSEQAQRALIALRSRTSRPEQPVTMSVVQAELGMSPAETTQALQEGFAGGWLVKPKPEVGGEQFVHYAFSVRGFGAVHLVPRD